MRNASIELINFLATSTKAVRYDLYTVTLSGGAVFRWSAADIPIQVPGGQLFDLGPLISDTGVKLTRGLKTDGIDITLNPDERHTINGVPMITFIRKNGLDGANFMIERAFAPGPGETIVGTYIRFKGRFSKVKAVSETEATISVSAWTELLNVSMPSDVYQSSCQNVLGDAVCGIDLETFKVAGVVQAVTSASIFDTDLAAAAGAYDLGTILFTTGPNTGVKKTVKTFAFGGLVTTIIGFPAPPNTGDAFFAYPGCRLSVANCDSPFNNRIHFRGTPFVPEATSAV